MEILVVEDDPGELRLLTETLMSGPTPKRISVARNGEEAIALLRRQGRHAGTRRPDLILMPLAAPRMDGHRVVAEIKSDDDLKRIPVLILTSSESDQDVQQAYESSANCYVRKPPEAERYVSVIQAIEEFWLNVVTLPPE